MISSSRKNRALAGFTLIEILLAVGLCAILTAVSVPTLVGWWEEHRLRMQADELIKLVQSAKLQAEKTGRPQVVVLLTAGESEPVEAKENIHYLKEEANTVWQLRRFGQSQRDNAPAFIEIDGDGMVSPISFRVSAKDKYIEYRFDFLTGHAHEVEFSF